MQTQTLKEILVSIFSGKPFGTKVPIVPGNGRILKGDTYVTTLSSEAQQLYKAAISLNNEAEALQAECQAEEGESEGPTTPPELLVAGSLTEHANVLRGLLWEAIYAGSPALTNPDADAEIRDGGEVVLPKPFNGNALFQSETSLSRQVYARIRSAFLFPTVGVRCQSPESTPDEHVFGIITDTTVQTLHGLQHDIVAEIKTVRGSHLSDTERSEWIGGLTIKEATLIPVRTKHLTRQCNLVRNVMFALASEAFPESQAYVAQGLRADWKFVGWSEVNSDGEAGEMRWVSKAICKALERTLSKLCGRPISIRAEESPEAVQSKLEADGLGTRGS